MTPRSRGARVKGRTLVLLAIGVALFVGLVVWQGIGDVGELLRRIGLGIVPVALFHFVPLALDAAGWVALLASGKRLGLIAACWLRWVCESVNTLLPVAKIGGEIVRAQMLAGRGWPGVVAGASVIVDLTVGFATQLAFSCLGLALLAVLGSDSDVIWATAATIGTGVLLLAGFVVAQRAGMFGSIGKLIARVTQASRWQGLVASAGELDAAVGELWRRRRAVAVCAGLRTAAWVVGAGEVWLTLWFLGQPIGVLDAVAFEAIGQTARAVGFAIPGGLGVQEGGYLLAGQGLGVSGETALTISLVRRGRELLLGVPGLIAWQWAEARRRWREARTAQ